MFEGVKFKYVDVGDTTLCVRHGGDRACFGDGPLERDVATGSA